MVEEFDATCRIKVLNEPEFNRLMGLHMSKFMRISKAPKPVKISLSIEAIFNERPDVIQLEIFNPHRHQIPEIVKIYNEEAAAAHLEAF